MKKINLILGLLLSIGIHATNCVAQDSYKMERKSRKAYMGVTLGISWGDGVEVSEICKNYGAERAGLRVGDIITAINNDPTNTKDEFLSVLEKHKAGEEVEVSYVRGKEKQKTMVKLAESPNGISISGGDWSWNLNENLENLKGDLENLKVKVKSKDKAFLGIYPRTNERENAVLIDGFTDNSAAQNAGLKKGDLITRIGDKPTADESTLRAVLDEFKPDDEVEIEYKRKGTISKIKVKLGREKYYSWDDFNISISEDSNEDEGSWEGQGENEAPNSRNSDDHKPTRTWSSYTFADGTEISINDFSVAPNPIVDKATVAFESTLTKPFSIVIYNAAGKEVARKEQTALQGKYSEQFDLSGVANGEYFIKIWMDSKEVFSQKLTKR